MKLDGKVMVVTGGSGALGQTVVPMLAQSGATVITVDRDAPAREVTGSLAMTADVTNEVDIARLIRDVIGEAGQIDGLINLVGGFAMGRVVDTDISLWQRMLTMNLTSGFLLSKAALSHMLQRQTGRIVHVAARAASEPFPGAAAYIVAKSGLVALIKTLSLEVAGSGVTVNGILPTTIDTPANRKNMPGTDTSKWVKPESIAQLLTFLVSQNAGQLNGALIPIG